MKWGHFSFQRSDRELKAETDYERSIAEAEKNLPDFPGNALRIIFFEDEAENGNEQENETI